MKDEQEKWKWLLKHIVEFTSTGSVLVFVTRKVNSEEVATSLRGEGHKGGRGELFTHVNVLLTHSHTLSLSLPISHSQLVFSMVTCLRETEIR